MSDPGPPDNASVATVSATPEPSLPDAPDRAAAVIPVPEPQAARVVDGPPVTQAGGTEHADTEMAVTDATDPETAADASVAGPADSPVADNGDAATAVEQAGTHRVASPWQEPGTVGPRAAVAFNLHRQPGQGEDADPILRQGTDVALIGVFDGMGGAGGTVYRTPDGARTGAFLASRTARDATERHIVASVQTGTELDGQALAEDLGAVLAMALADRLQELHAPPSGLRSRLLRALPTTMAVALLQRPDADSPTWRCHLFSAGDSRVYLLQPDTGAQQLTLDDIRDHGDAMANLRQDSVVSNALSADTPFEISYRRLDLDEPFVLLAATDGCFGYLPSPMHFERTVLAAMCGGAEPMVWSELLQEAVGAVAGDDAAMALLAVGAEASDVPALFGTRLRWLDEHVIAPLDEKDAAVRDAEQRLATARAERDRTATALWTQYKTSYISRLPNGVPQLAETGLDTP